MEIQAFKEQERQNKILERFAVQLVVRNPGCIVKANHEEADAPNPIDVHGQVYVPDITLFDGRTKHIYEVRTALSLNEAQCQKRLQAISDYVHERNDIVMHLVIPHGAEHRAQALAQSLDLDIHLDVAAY